MRSYLHINIKGRALWGGCAALIMAIIITCCSIINFTVDQPDTAVVGANTTIKVQFTYHNIYQSKTQSLVFGFLAPKGWATAQNAKITYTSTATTGTGNMKLMDPAAIEPQSNGLSWSAAMKKKFGIGGNLIDDMEWVVYQSDVSVVTSNGGDITVYLTINMKMGADGNNTLCKLGYAVAETSDGLHDPDGSIDKDPGVKYEYFAETITPCFQLTGGPGDVVDFCNPQLTSYDPPKALDNDFFTITFDGTVANTGLNNPPAVYLCAIGNTADGKSITVCEQTAKTKLTQTTANSNRYKITIWPRKFFGITDAQTITNMTYYITDATGNIKVGYGNTASPFTYTFKCK